MYITAIDLGSSQIKGIVAELKKDGSLIFLKTIKRDSAGIKRGEIIYPEETVKNLVEVLNEIKHFDKKCLKNLVFGISGTRSRFNLSRAAVSIPRPDFEILQEDVDRVIRESMAVNLPVGWQIVHSLPREFIIDDIEMDDPDVIGLSGKKLEANVVLISVFSSIYKNFMKVSGFIFGKKTDFEGNIIFSPLACDRAILSRQQKELGAVLIDVGFGTTSVVVYEDGRILNACVLPVGSGNITNDLAIGLKCSVTTAEKIKISMGSSFAREVSSKDKIDMSEFEEGQSSQVSKKYIAEIIEVRAREIFSLVNNQLKSLGKAGKLPSGAILTGGGAKLQGILDIARQELRLPAQVSFPLTDDFEVSSATVSDQIQDSEMSVAVGLALTKSDLIKKGEHMGPFGKRQSFNDSWFKKFIKALMPSD
ncbi:MAG: cell division protein FtsA [Candidatus Paceibacterota bacterium]|jgi:cell division protein FtsA